MGIYKRVDRTCGNPGDLYANVRGDGNKATVHSPFGTKVYQRVTTDSVDNDILMKIKSNPNLSIKDLIPYIDALGDYIFLTNKPKINGVVLEGDLSTEDLKIYSKVGADGVYFDDGETIQEKYDNGSLSGVNDYTQLKSKPSINGVILNGDLNSASLGIIDDETPSTQSTWSSMYIKKQIEDAPAVITSIKGTDADPIIAADLKLGSYVISGKIQSSQNNVTTIRVSKPKQYIVNRDVEGTTVLWEQNPFAASQYYIVFYHEGPDAPQEKTIEVLTKEDLATAKLDCGYFE